MSYMDRDTYGIYGASHTGPGPSMMGAHTILTNDVYNQKGVALGDIKEIMLDVREGKVAYAVLAFGGILGLGEKLFAVPWDALTVDTAHERFILNIDKEELKNAPGFDKDAWPNMADKKWAAQIHDYYDTRPYYENKGEVAPTQS